MNKRIAGLVALMSLVACLVYPALYFHAVIGEAALKTGFAVVSVVWFAAATWWGRKRV